MAQENLIKYAGSDSIQSLVNVIKRETAPINHTHVMSDIEDFPELGTASEKDVPISGDATSTQVVMGDDSRLTDARPASDVSEWAKASTKPTYTASEIGAVSILDVGVSNGVAELDGTGKVPSSQLPSYVDDIEEYQTFSSFPVIGETGKIYIALDTNQTYRWGGSEYVAISSDLALGETSSTAYRGDRGKAAYDFSQDPYTSTPTMNGIATAGVSDKWSRGDHVHPTDTSKADITYVNNEFSRRNNLFYAICNTDKDVTEKEVTLSDPNYIPVEGDLFAIYFPKSNSIASPKLIINNTEAKPLRLYAASDAYCGGTPNYSFMYLIIYNRGRYNTISADFPYLVNRAFRADIADSADKWSNSAAFLIKDSDGTNTGTASSVNGSSDVELLLPSTIKAALTGNATTATTATNLSGFTKDGNYVGVNLNNVTTTGIYNISRMSECSNAPISNGRGTLLVLHPYTMVQVLFWTSSDTKDGTYGIYMRHWYINGAGWDSWKQMATA